MQTNRKTNFSTVILHILFAVAMAFADAVLDNGEPFSLAIAFAMATAGLSPIAAFFSYFAVQALSFHVPRVLLAFCQALLLGAVFLSTEKLGQRSIAKRDFCRLFALGVALVGFVLFAPFTPYSFPFAFNGAFGGTAQKIILATAVFLLSAVFTVALNALLKKLFKCRLRGDELIFSAVFLVFLGVGLCRFLGLNAYLGVAFFLLLTFHFSKRKVSFCYKLLTAVDG